MAENTTQLDLTGPLQVEILPNGLRAKLTRSYKVRTAAGRIIEAPEGFETDFASVPRFFWRILPPWGRYSPAAVIHDRLYYTGEVAKKDADGIFRELMAALGVPQWKRFVMYQAVRRFGGFAWREHRKRQAANA